MKKKKDRKIINNNELINFSLYTFYDLYGNKEKGEYDVYYLLKSHMYIWDVGAVIYIHSVCTSFDIYSDSLSLLFSIYPCMLKVPHVYYLFIIIRYKSDQHYNKIDTSSNSYSNNTVALSKKQINGYWL